MYAIRSYYGHDNVLNPHVLCEFCVGFEVQILAVDGDQTPGTQQFVESREFVLRRMAGNVDVRHVARGDDFDSERREGVLDFEHRALVAGDHPRGKDHRVPRPERDVGVSVAGDARERGARLALRSGGDVENA